MPARLPSAAPLRTMADAEFPNEKVQLGAEAVPKPLPHSLVGDTAQDDAHELVIQRAREELEAAQRMCEESGHTFADLAERDLCLLRFQELLKARSPEQVQRMLDAQAQAMALEPGARR